jgi:hypothetical protein
MLARPRRSISRLIRQRLGLGVCLGVAACPSIGCAPYAWTSHRLSAAGLPAIPTLPTYGGVPAVSRGSYGRNGFVDPRSPGSVPGSATSHYEVAPEMPCGSGCQLHSPFLLSTPTAGPEELAPWPRFHPVPTRPVYGGGGGGTGQGTAPCSPAPPGATEANSEIGSTLAAPLLAQGDR